MTTMNISLPEEMKAFIDAQIAREGYATASEYLRALIREAQKRQAKLDTVSKRDRRPYRRARFKALRAQVELSQLIRAVEFTEGVKRRMIDEIKEVVEAVQHEHRDQSQREGDHHHEREGQPSLEGARHQASKTTRHQRQPDHRRLSVPRRRTRRLGRSGRRRGSPGHPRSSREGGSRGR